MRDVRVNYELILRASNAFAIYNWSLNNISLHKFSENSFFETLHHNSQF